MIDDEAQQSIEDLAAALADLRIHAGKPSFARIQSLSKLRGSDSAVGKAASLPSTTASDAVRGKRLPSAATVLAFVDACRRAAYEDGIVIDSQRFEPAMWQQRWRMARDLQDMQNDASVTSCSAATNSGPAVGVTDHGEPAVPAPTAVQLGDKIAHSGTTFSRADPLMSVSTNRSNSRSDLLQDVLRKPTEIQISSIEILESNIFAAQVIRFDRLTGIVGRHGTGKTLLLRLLDHAFGLAPHLLAQPNLGTLEHLGNPIEFVADVTVLRAGQPVTRRVESAADGSDRESGSARYRGWESSLGAEFAPHLLSVPLMFDLLENHNQEFDRRFRANNYDQHAQYDYTTRDLHAAREIVGRDYASITAHSYWHSRDPEGSAFRFAAIDVDGNEIGTSMMSLGEIWTHYLLGHENLVTDAHEPRLIDEPESFLAPRGHGLIVDELIRQTVRHRRQLILSTHSPQVLSRFPVSNLRMCTRTSNGIRVAEPTSLAQVRDAIGVEVAVRVVVLVEDALAATVFTLLCEQTDPSLAREVEVVATGGPNEVVAGLRVMSSSGRIIYVGVLDGDLRSNPTPPFAAGRLFFLPGMRSPEHELRHLASRAPSKLAQKLGCSTWDIEVALDSLTRLDHQYWIGRVAEQLARPPEVLTHALVTLWMQEAEISEFIEVVSHIRRISEGVTR
ncbi:ATP-binding protein [Nocardia carnea]|uniref:ATP-binding protein n=1 Tax=Nocardia carnea TaxID=37328 RepID=A0ABW7TWP6_9NOCA|nr:ATP-binding protein [Nocardia carnea]